MRIMGAKHEPVQPYLIQPQMEQLLEQYHNSTQHIIPKLARFHIESRNSRCNLAISFASSLTIQDFPKLYLTISYKDIQGAEIKKKVKIGFEPIVYNKETNGEGNCSLRVRNLGEEIVNE